MPPCPMTHWNSWTDCFGTIYYKEGMEKYFDEIKNARPHGQGTLTYADGGKYVGEWKDTKFHEQGTFTSADGRKYTLVNGRITECTDKAPIPLPMEEY